MKTLNNLIDAATLKGYLMATNAPENIIALATAIVDGGLQSLRPDTITGSGIEGFLPQFFSDAVAAAAAMNDILPAKKANGTKASDGIAPVEDLAPGTPATPPADETSEVPDEATQEALKASAEPAQISSLKIPNGNRENVWEEWQVQKLLEMKRNKAKGPEIATAVGKTAVQVNNKWTWLSKALKDETQPTGSGRLSKASPPTEDASSKAGDEDESWNYSIPDYRLAEIVAFRRVHNFRITAEQFGVGIRDMVVFLERHRVDDRLFPSKAVKADTQQMKYETVIRKDSWGNQREVRVPLPVGKTKDPISGATVTKYPPGYAIGAGPQRNVKPTKGGY